MTSPKEKGQRIEGVHHSEVSETLFRRADEGKRKEERMGGREFQRRGGGAVSYLSGYWLSAKSSAYRVGLHPLCANQSSYCLCFTITCCL